LHKAWVVNLAINDLASGAALIPPTPSPKLRRRGASFKVSLLGLGEGFRVRAKAGHVPS